MYLDCEATSHVTNNINRIDHPNDPKGKINLVVGNGNKLKVEKVGFSTLSNVNDKILQLSNILYSPEIKKNLQSIYKVANDNKRLSKDDGTPLKDATKYKRIIGALQYLTNTRIDILFAINKLS